tara:strand:- start:49 stop:519 length:471 start_codon:yes stop_codon:yes gene_type:complete
MNFDDSFKVLIGHEGGYGWDPRDPGGETKYGISKRGYPDEDIKNLTLDRAKEIYKRDYWDALKLDALPGNLRFMLFDAGVNSGIGTATKWLQRCLGVKDDGILGPTTLATANAANVYRLAARFNGMRLQALTNLPTFNTFGRGWARRIAENLINIT